MTSSLRRAAFLLALASSLAAQAVERLNVTWNEEVGRTVRFLGVEVGPPAGGERVVTLHYQVLKLCRRFSLAGHSMTREGRRLARFVIASERTLVGFEQKLSGTATVAYADGHYLMVDEVSCE